MPRARSQTFIARGRTHREALRALFRDLEAALPEASEDAELVTTVQMRSEHDGADVVAEAAVWRVRRHRETDD